MGRISSKQVPDGVQDTYDLSGRGGTLNLSSKRYNLKDNELEEALGLDIEDSEGVSPLPARRPVGVSIPVADRPLTSVFQIGAKDKVLDTLRLINDGTIYGFTLIQGEVTYNPSTGQAVGSVGFFTDYTWRPGDKISVHLPQSLRGHHEILGKVNDQTISLPPGLAGASTVIDSGFIMQGRHVTTTDDTLDSSDGVYGTGGLDRYGSGMLLVKGPDLYDLEGPWTGFLEGSTLLVDEDSRWKSKRTCQVLGIVTYAEEGDAIWFHPNHDMSSRLLSKLTISRIWESSLEGILVTNGRKFWLQRNGVYELVLDLNNDVFLGTEWRTSRIAQNRFLLVSSKFAPRILHLNRTDPVVSEEGEVLAGCIAPHYPSIEVLEEGTVINCSWVMDNETGKGNLDAGEMKVLIRGVNYEDSLFSNFIPVIDSTDNVPTSGTNSSLDTTVSNGDGLSVWTVINNLRRGGDEQIYGTPPIHSRITHIEVWRTQSGGGTYYLESVMAINRDYCNEPTSGGTTFSWFDSNPSEEYPVQLDNADATGLPVLTTSERVSGGLPPICRDVASLYGITICFGKADEERVNPSIYAKSFFSKGGEYTASGPNGPNMGDVVNGQFTYYERLEGDQIVVVFGGTNGTLTFPEGVYEVNLETPGGSEYINLDPDGTYPASDIGAGANDEKIHYYIRRPVIIEWPAISSDEDVWYSRTDKFGPESFPPRILSLSRTGDVFRRAISFEDRVVVIMDQGVHLLYLSDTELLKRTLGYTGLGTPWKDSVVVYEDTLFWATPDGIRTLITSLEPDDQGRLGKFGSLGGEKFRDWFRAAFDNKEDIDAGIDTRSFTIRFRRHISDHKVQVLAYNFKTNKWTLIDDDNGLAYVSSKVAGASELSSPVLYSVDGVTGALFELGSVDVSDPYEGFTSDDQLSKSVYDIKTTQIKCQGTGTFSSLMLGEIVRFSSGNPEVDGVLRTVTKVTSKYFEFDSVPGLSEGDEFSIGPRRFRLRPAPVKGRDPRSMKEFRGLYLRARRNGNPVPSDLSLRLYSSFRNTPDAQGSVEVFDDDDAGKTSADRVVSLEASGTALQLEVENLKSRRFFDIELAYLDIFEGSGKVSDVEAT